MRSEWYQDRAKIMQLRRVTTTFVLFPHFAKLSGHEVNPFRNRSKAPKHSPVRTIDVPAPIWSAHFYAARDTPSEPFHNPLERFEYSLSITDFVRHLSMPIWVMPKSNARSRVSLADSAGSPPTNPGADTTPISRVSANDRWANLRRLGLEVQMYPCSIHSSSFPKVVEGLVECIKLFENQSNGNEEFKSLQSELDTLFRQLGEGYPRSIIYHTTPSVNRLCRLAHIEVQGLLDRRGHYARGRNRDRELLACYRRIQSYLQRAMANFEISWSTTTGSNMGWQRESGPFTYKGTAGRRPCTPGTRVEVLEYILSWVDTSNSDPVFWVNGMAGTGKTRIAYSLCEMLDATNQLAASFFCSRELGYVQNGHQIITSIARQLADYSCPFRSFWSISQSSLNHPSSLSLQFDVLIAEPLSKAKETLPVDIVVVIDALDECRDKKMASEILEVLLTRSAGLPIKFIVSSRPEPEIRGPMEKQMDRAASRIVLHELDRNIVQADIKTYLQNSLVSIRASEDQIQQLAQKSGAFFWFAGTAVQYISSNDFRYARTWLALFLGGESVIEIDQLYALILQVALGDPNLDEEYGDDIRRVLNVVLRTEESLGVDSIATLLKMNTDQVWAALRPLYSVLCISEGGDRVSPLHPSFAEYIFDPSRSGEYCCLLEAYSQTMAQRCFRRFRDMQPQFNICGFESSYVPDHRLLGLERRVNNVIPANLFYAARRWATYLQPSTRSPDLLQDLEEFLSVRLLLWMEVMNLKGCANAMPPAMRLAKEWAEAGDECSADLKALIADAWRFTTTFALGSLTDSTPHIYVSMLPFWPVSSPISKCYARRMRRMIKAEGTAIEQRQYALLATWNFKKPTRSPVYSADGAHITAGVGNEVLLMDASTGRLVLPPFRGHNDLVLSVQFSSDGTRIVSGSLDKTIRVWSIQSGETIVGPIQGHTNKINSVAFSPDNTCFISGSQDETIHVWDSSNGASVFEIAAKRYGSITEVKYSHNGKWIIGCSWKGITVWAAQNQYALKTFIPKRDDIPFHSVDISPNNTYIASGSINNSVCVWDIESGQAVWGPLQPDGIIHEPFISVSFSPDGSYIASSSPSHNELYVWDAQSGTLVHGPLEGHTDRITSCRFSPDGSYIASGSYDNTLRLWSTQFMQTIDNPLPGHFSSVTSVGFSPDGTRIVSDSSDRTVCVWDSEDGAPVLGPLEKGYDNKIQTAYSPDGTRIISGSPNGLVLLDAQTGRITLGPLRFRQSIRSAVLSSDGTRIILGTTDTIYILAADTRQGQILMEICPPATSQSKWVHVTSVACSPDDASIAVGSIHSSVSVHDTHTGRLACGPLEGHNNESRSLAFSPDGTRLVLGSFSTVLVQDARNGKTVLGPLGGHTGWVHSVEFSPDSIHIVCGARDNAVSIWDAITGRLVLGPIRWHSAPVRSVRFSPDGTRVASGSDDKTIRVTNIKLELQSPSEYLSPTGGEWKLNANGWVVDKQGRLLVWVPSELHSALMWPQTELLISRKGCLRLNFKDTYLGNLWKKCYNFE